jgi:Cu+-exporting ATPase
MTVDIDENKVDSKKIIKAIENAGYGASISSDSISSDSISNKNIPNNNIASNNDSGDNKVVANEIAKQVGIKNVYSEVLPQHKEQIVSNLQKGNPVNVAKVAFVGDGINDSPALAKSDVGIAIGSGTDIAIDSADIILVRDSLIDVVNAIKLSKKTLKNVRENLFWAFFYNAICIPLAAGLFYKSFGLELNPMIGSLAMSLSSLFVVTNALRLRFVKMQK